MKHIIIVFAVVVLGATTASAQVKIVIPSKINEPIPILTSGEGPANCYTLAAIGQNTSLVGSPSRKPVTQENTSGLLDFQARCIETFYSVAQTDKLFTAHDADFQKKLDDVKKEYVDKISSLSPEVLAAIKDEVKQQLIAELVPQIRDEIKKQLEQVKAAKGGTSGPKPKTKAQQPAPKSDPKPATLQN